MNNYQFQSFYHSLINDITLIRGPPGTGKTKTICSILRYYLETKSNCKLLVCSPTNIAIDNIILEMKKDYKLLNGDLYKIKMTRLGNTDNDECKKYQLNVLLYL